MDKIIHEYNAIMEKIADLEDILANHSRVLSIVKEEISVLRDKYGDERRTEIQTVSGEVDIEDLIPVEECVLALTHRGYIKRQAIDAYKTQKRGGRGVTGIATREEDFAEELFVCSTHDYVLFFTSRGRVLRLKGYEVPQGGRTSKGTNIVNLLPIETGEKVLTMIRIPEFREDQYLVFVTKNGIIKRTPLMDYNTARKNGVIALRVDEDDELRWVRLTDGNSDLIVGTKNGVAIRFQESDVRLMGRTARGVKAITLRDGDEVVGMSRVRDNALLLTVTDKGQGRRTDPAEYRLQSRGGLGIKNYPVGEEKGLVAGIKMVDEDDDVIMITTDGIIIRIPVADISVQSRYAGGVRVMRVDEGERIVTLARAPKMEEPAEQTEEEPSTEE